MSGTMTATSIGKVYCVGAGPRDRELIILKGKRCLEAVGTLIVGGEVV